MRGLFAVPPFVTGAEGRSLHVTDGRICVFLADKYRHNCIMFDAMTEVSCIAGTAPDDSLLPWMEVHRRRPLRSPSSYA